jgi:hypothetical protein
VQGSFDSPPIVITMSRWKMGLLMLIAIAFTATGAWMISRDSGDFRGYLCTGFFGLGVLAFIWRFLSPPRLEISRQGISWFTGRKTLDFAWKDFAAFRVYKPSSRAMSKYVGYDYAPDNPKRGRMAAVAHAMAGVDGGFGGQWEISADDVAALLNQAKAKWG